MSEQLAEIDDPVGLLEIVSHDPVAKLVAGGPDEGKGQRISEGGAKRRRYDVSGNYLGKRRGDHEMQPEKWRPGSDHSRRHAGGYGVRRRRQPQYPLSKILE
jgi:hypothetical protein